MKRILVGLLVSVFLIGVGWYLPNCTERRTEVNAMTGEFRTREQRAYMFNTEWKVTPTWLGDSADRQGISTNDGWQNLSTLSETPIFGSRGSSRAPASYSLRAIPAELLDLTSPTEIDQFAREFIGADEAKRKQMISMR